MPNMLFCGYRNFESKKGNNCFVLNFLTPVVVSQDNSRANSEIISIFTDEKKYFDFVRKNPVMSKYDVKQDVVGSKVYYSI